MGRDVEKHRAYQRAYGLANRAKISARVSAWRAANPDRACAIRRRSEAAHRGEAAARYAADPTIRARKQASARAWNAANPERKRAYNNARYHSRPSVREAERAKSYFKRYGIRVDQYELALARQGGGCAICGHPPKRIRLSVDHEHGGKRRVRGALCHICNRTKVGTNTVETARRVLAYLESDFDMRNL